MRLYLDTLPRKINKDNLEQYKRNSVDRNFFYLMKVFIKLQITIYCEKNFR